MWSARQRPRTGLMWLVTLIVLVGWCVSPSTPTFGVQTSEAHVKAVFLYNLIHFVTWPQGEDRVVEPFVIGIVGDRLFADIVAEAVKGEKKGEAAIEVRYFERLEEVSPDQSQILFIGESQNKHWEQFMANLAGRPVLVVGDSDGFSERGGMVSLVRAEKRLQIEINLQAVERAQLTISAKLLSLARLIR